MRKTERWELIAETTGSIFDNFEKAVSRAAALFGSPEESLEKFILPELGNILGVNLNGKPNISPEANYAGHTRDLRLLMGVTNMPWHRVINCMAHVTREGRAAIVFKPGDFFDALVRVPSAKIDGYSFPEINVESRLVVTAAYAGRVILNYEDVILCAPINKNETNEGGFKASLLAKYLNDHFLKAVFAEVEEYLTQNTDGLKVSLPTFVEVFGFNEDSDYSATNWGSSGRLPYFEKCTNRIKVRAEDRDDTHWHWLSTPRAVNSTHVCCVSGNGNAGSTNASRVDGGVSPAICVS
jgi:hypothetical protein